MTMPSPYEVGAKIGGNLAGIGHRAMQRSSMDDIIQQAQQTGDPTQLNNIMGQILKNIDPENRKDVIAAVQQRQQQFQKQQQKSQAAKYYQSQGMDPNIANLDINLQRDIIKNQTSTDRAKMQPFLTGLDIINRQRELLKQGNLGPKVAVIGTGRKIGSSWTKQGIKDRSEYERLGKSLISLATSIPIRNRLEFEILSEGLFDPTKKKEEIEGALEGMERIIRNNLGTLGGQQQVESQTQMKTQQQQYVKGQTATNPKTGKTLTFNGSSWE